MTQESSSDDGSVETVLRVMEGLRGDAFQKAKDIGIAALSAARWFEDTDCRE